MEQKMKIGIMILLSLVTCGMTTPLFAADTYTIKWETEGFANPESVIFDEARGVLYVSNLNGPPTEKDANGFISKLSPDGTLQQLDWVAGLDAPKGMAIAGDRLFVADIDAIVEIDIAGGTVLNRHAVSGAIFLNDVVAESSGAVLVSDSATNTIHRLDGGRLEAWLTSTDLNGPNGLYVDGVRLIVGSFGSPEKPGQLLAVSMTDKSITSLSGNQPVGSLDGVEPGGVDSYLVTDWVGGKVLRVGPGGTVTTVIELKQGSADLDHVTSQHMLYIPLMLDGKVAAYTTQP